MPIFETKQLCYCHIYKMLCLVVSSRRNSLKRRRYCMFALYMQKQLRFCFVCVCVRIVRLCPSSSTFSSLITERRVGHFRMMASVLVYFRVFCSFPAELPWHSRAPQSSFFLHWYGRTALCCWVWLFSCCVYCQCQLPGYVKNMFLVQGNRSHQKDLA
jgi:hypothetical protein